MYFIIICNSLLQQLENSDAIYSSLMICLINVINEFRPEIKMLFSNLNEQKEVLKQNGIMVDGKMYKVSFKG